MRRKLFTLAFNLMVIGILSGASIAAAQGPDEEDFFKDPEATDEHCGYTDETTAGPYYVSGAPETDTLLLQDIEGDAMVISGVVYDGATGEVIPAVHVEVWHADADGSYYPEDQGDIEDFDEADINLRGTIVADEEGAYTFTSIVPGLYEDRRRHIHYYITAEGYLPLYTQTYWADDPNLEIDTTDAATEECRTLTFEPVEDSDVDAIGATYDFYLRPDPDYVAVEMPEFTLINLNTASEAELKTIPGVGDRMVREFKEYRPYISISQFRREIGKYVDDDQVEDYEAYVYVPVNVNDSDAETLKQIPGVDDDIAEALMDARPYDSNEDFLAALGEYVTPEQALLASFYLEAE